MSAPSLDTAVRWIVPPHAVAAWRADPKAARAQAVSWHSQVVHDGLFLLTRATGIDARRDWDDDASVVYPWTAVRDRIAAMPDGAVEHLVALCRENAEHQRSFVPFAAPAEAQGCGRTPEIGPPTKAQALYDEAWETWSVEHAEPYHARARELHAAIAAAYDACFDTADLVLFEVAS